MSINTDGKKTNQRASFSGSLGYILAAAGEKYRIEMFGEGGFSAAVTA